jgi:hypothetical protein
VSILLTNVDPRLAGPLIELLMAQGDEVRVVEDDRNRTVGERWRGYGAKVAWGPADDPDLVERAAQGVRTIVVMERTKVDTVSALRSALEAGRAAGVDRVVLCTTRPSESALRALRSSDMDYVVLELASPRSRLSRAFRREDVWPKFAEAVSAADDLAGSLRLELDLSKPAAWDALHLETP